MKTADETTKGRAMTKPKIELLPYTQSEVNAILRGMDEFLIENAKRQAETAPRCHFRRMISSCGDNDEWWWECSICGHTKDSQPTAQR